jgi:hypothetical protein
MPVQSLFLPGRRPKSHKRLYFQLLAAEKGDKMFSELHYSLYFAPAAFYLFMKVKSELASCLLTQGTFKKSL